MPFPAEGTRPRWCQAAGVRNSATGSTREQAGADQKRLGHLFHGLRLLTDSDRESGQGRPVRR